MSGNVTVSPQDAWLERVLGIAPSSLTSGDTVPVGRDRLLRDVKRIKQEIDTQLGRAMKPVALKERLQYLTSEIEQYKQLVEKHDGEEKEKFRTSIALLTGALDKARKDGVKLSADALSEHAGKLHEEAMKIADESIGSSERKDIYKKRSVLLAQVVRERRDWEAQVQEAGDFLGNLRTLMEIGLERLAGVEEHLNRTIARDLPKLTSKIGTKPDNVPVTGGGAKVEDPATAMTGCGNDWVTAKQTYGATPEEMKKLAAYRKNLVDAWLKTNLAPWGLEEGPGKGWVAVGSTDPTSDYDISINKHGARKLGARTVYKYDYQIVQEFNDYFRKTYGVESGTLFDTNLYASAPSIAPTLPESGSEEEMAAVNEIKASADVGALMKIRRYMTSSEFEDFRVRTVGGLGDESAKKKLDAQFRAADANYMISLLAVVEKMREQLKDPIDEAKLSPEQKEERKHASHLIDAWSHNQDVSGLALADAEAALEKLANELLHARDASTSATNDLYAEAIGKARAQEQAIAQFQEFEPQVKQLFARALKEGVTDFGAFADVLDGYGVQPRVLQKVKDGDLAGAAKEVEGQLASMLSDLAQHNTLAMFYANEAYQSGGPFRHVVWAGQAVETDVKAEYVKGGKSWGDPATDEQKALVEAERKKRRDALSQEECLQSFNEQLGDFLKDLEHYGDKEPGVAIIQSSKYLERLVDALSLMSSKGLFAGDPGLTRKVQSQLDLQSRLTKELIAARKGNLWMEPVSGTAPVDQVEQRRAYACDFMSKLGIASVAALGKTYVALGVEVNGVARKAIGS